MECFSLTIPWKKDFTSRVAGYYAGRTQDYFVFQDCSYTRFVLAIDNMNRMYHKQYLMEISNSAASEAEMIQLGRKDAMHFQAVRRGDSLYAVWRQGEGDSDLLFGAKRHRKSIKYAVYDGKKWSKPIDAVPTERIGDDILVAPMALFFVNEIPHVLWSGSVGEGKNRHYELNTAFADSSGNWRELMIPTPDFEMLGSNRYCNAVMGSDGTIHLIAGEPGNSNSTKYFALRNDKWFERGRIIEGARKQSIVTDGENPYLLWVENSDSSGTLKILPLREVELIPLQ